MYPILGMATAVAMLASSCVTNEYDLNNINTEVTVGGDGLELPIGYIDTLTIDSLLSSFDEIPYLQEKENGDLGFALDSSISYAIDAIEIAPLENLIPQMDPIVADLSEANNSFPEEGFQLPEINFDYTVAIPTYTINDESTKLPDMKFDIPIKQFGSLVDGMVIPSVAAGFAVPLSVSGEEAVKLSFPCPEQVKGINKVWLAGQGAHVQVNFSLGGLSSVATNNVIKHLQVTLPENYSLQLDNNLGGCATLNAKGNQLTVTNYTVNSGDVTISAHIKSIDLSNIKAENGMISCDDKLTYELSYEFTTKSGTVSTTPLPEFGILIEDAVFEDAELVSNQITINPIESDTPLKYELKGLSPDLKSVRHIDFNKGSDIVIKLIMTQGEIPFKGWKECPITIGMPDCFRLDADRLVGAEVDEGGHILSTTIGDLMNGVHLPVTSLQFGETGAVVEVSDTPDGKKTGTLVIDDHLSVEIAPVFPSSTYKLSEITKAMGDKKISVMLDESHLIIKPETSEIVIHQISSEISFEEEIKYTLKDIRSELKHVDKVSVADADGNPVVLDVAFTLSETPVSHLLLSDFAVELPKCLWIEAEGLDENNVLKIGDKRIDLVENQKVLLAQIKIMGIKDLDVVDGSINIDDKVKLSGVVAIPEGEIMHGVSNDIVITPLVELPALHIQEFVGRVNIDLGSQIDAFTFDLSELTKQLQDSKMDIEFGLVPPVLCLEVANPIGVSIDGELHLTAHYPDSSTLPLNVPLHLDGAQNGERGVSKLCITDNPSKAPAGYSPVTPENYDKLFSKIPSKLDITVEGAIDEQTVCTLALGEAYQFDLDFSVDVPVALNADLELEGSFGELSGTFEEVAGWGIQINEVGVVIETESTLPMDLSAAVKALDKDGKEVEGIKLDITGSIGGCGSDGQAKHSVLGVSFSGNIDNLNQVESIAYTLRGAVGGGNAAQFNTNQFLRAEAYVQAKKGVTFDIVTLMNPKNDEGTVE